MDEVALVVPRRVVRVVVQMVVQVVVQMVLHLHLHDQTGYHRVVFRMAHLPRQGPHMGCLLVQCLVHWSYCAHNRAQTVLHRVRLLLCSE